MHSSCLACSLAVCKEQWACILRSGGIFYEWHIWYCLVEMTNKLNLLFVSVMQV